MRRFSAWLALVLATAWPLSVGAQPAPTPGPPSPDPDPPSVDAAGDAGESGIDAPRTRPEPTAKPRPVDRTLLRPPRPPVPLPPAPPSRAEVDIITRAGEDERPPDRQASITLEDGQRVAWDPAWKKFGTTDWVLTGVSMGAAVGGILIPPSEERWLGRNGFDQAVRNSIRPNSLTDRLLARDASDVMLMLSINQVLVDTLVVTWWGHDADTVAWNMALMNVETIVFNTALNQLAGGLASRQRPYAVECDTGDAETQRRDCRGRKFYRSFWSGHTSTTFAIAGATCMHHAHMPLYGGGFADVLPCVATVALAGATGTLRLVADQHWATDVLVGAAMGTFSGLAVPYFLHYGWDERPLSYENDAISVNVMPLPTGGAVVGSF